MYSNLSWILSTGLSKRFASWPTAAVLAGRNNNSARVPRQTQRCHRISERIQRTPARSGHLSRQSARPTKRQERGRGDHGVSSKDTKLHVTFFFGHDNFFG